MVDQNSKIWDPLPMLFCTSANFIKPMKDKFKKLLSSETHI